MLLYTNLYIYTALQYFGYRNVVLLWYFLNPEGYLIGRRHTHIFPSADWPGASRDTDGWVKGHNSNRVREVGRGVVNSESVVKQAHSVSVCKGEYIISLNGRSTVNTISICEIC